jgi:epoxide hydrolase-like predicted phosphatase
MGEPEQPVVKIVVFDLGNVLLPFDHLPIAKRLHARARDRAAHTADQIHNYIFDWDNGSYIRYEAGEISTDAFVGDLCERFGLDLDLAGFKAIWNDIFRQDDGVAAIIRELKARKVPLYLLSNTNEMHYRHCRETYPVMELFDQFVASHEVKMRKPDRVIYKEVLRRAPGVRPDEVLFIDDWELNIAGAQAVGIRTHHYTNAVGLRALLEGEALL